MGKETHASDEAACAGDGRAPAALSEVEAARRAIQSELDRAKSAQQRNREGQFATPPALALEIARWIGSWWNDRARLRFLEPALGTGAFYGALLEVFGEARMQCALGIERDPAFAGAARTLWGATQLRVHHGDFLESEPPAPDARFNLIVTNPPYVRHHHLAVDEKARLRAQPWARGRNLSGLAGLYVHFLLAADAWLDDEGVGVWLMPSECLDANYGAALRSYLAREVTLLRVHCFDALERKFEEALVTSAVIAYVKRRPDTDRCRRVTFSSDGSLLQPKRCVEIAAGDLGAEARWSRLARLHTKREAAPALRLGDVFEVRRGIATGANDFFILPLARACELGLPMRALRPILPSPRRIRGTVIEARPDGYPDLESPLALLDCSDSSEDIEARWPALSRYLEQGEARKLHLRYLARHRRPWYAQERREPAPFLCTYMGRAILERGARPFRFLWNRSQAIAPNVYLMMYPKASLRAALEADPQQMSRVHALLQAIDAEILRSEGRTYGGGLYKLEPRELVALPVAGLEPLLSED